MNLSFEFTCFECCCCGGGGDAMRLDLKLVVLFILGSEFLRILSSLETNQKRKRIYQKRFNACSETYEMLNNCFASSISNINRDRSIKFDQTHLNLLRSNIKSTSSSHYINKLIQQVYHQSSLSLSQPRYFYSELSLVKLILLIKIRIIIIIIIIIMDQKCRCLYKLLMLSSNDRGQGWEHFFQVAYKNWKTLIAITHPDKNGSTHYNVLASKLINHARDILCNQANELVYLEFGQGQLSHKHSCQEAAQVLAYLDTLDPFKSKLVKVEASSSPSKPRPQISLFQNPGCSASSSSSSSSNNKNVKPDRFQTRKRHFGNLLPPKTSDNSHSTNNFDDSSFFHEDENESQTWPTTMKNLPDHVVQGQTIVKILDHENRRGELSFLVEWKPSSLIQFSREGTHRVLMYPQVVESYVSYLWRKHPRRVPYLYLYSPEIEKLCSNLSTTRSKK